MRIPFTLFLLVIGSYTVLATNDRSERAIKSKPVVNKKTELVEGSGAPLKELSAAAPSDLELHSSGNGGYSSDDEDGDDIQGSGAPPSDKVEGSGSPLDRLPPASSTSTTTAPIVTGTRSTTTTHAVFNPVKELPDPVVHVEEKDDHAIVTEIREPAKPASTTAAAPTTTSRRIIPASPDDIPTGSPFSPIPKPGIVAALIGGAVIGLITAVLLVMFIVHRMRKKDEGSYALDEPKPRPYSNYPYSKAPNKEFYA